MIRSATRSGVDPILQGRLAQASRCLRPATWLLALPVLLGLAQCATATAPRGIRIDFAGDWGDGSAAYAIGSANCPGSSATNTLVYRVDHEFSGDSDPNQHFDVDTYCQKTVPYVDDFTTYFSKNSFFSDEQALGYLVGLNKNNAVSGIRYTYLSGPRFSQPNGFQWAYFQFPYGLTIVGIYGLTGITLTDAYTYIQGPSQTAWRGGTDGYNGQYFCFETVAGASSYIGTWNGSLTDNGSVCLRKAARVFVDSFEN